MFECDLELKNALNQLKEGYAGFSKEMKEEDIIWKLFEFYIIAVSNDLKCVDFIFSEMEIEGA